ncbi:hypothetical protein FSP39_023160 [Pinctada imbricata]|uniref:Uncharacterized protein n=1 Tax=Pinctada imbricata TaxID=66713 RepID=A0AA88XGN7_PINIB|nr:hypothetical protein FSP39_023160 [Pinctada imbricata]
MVLRCAWGTCNGDERYPERQGPDGRLILFPKPKTEPEKCLRWIKACGRPHEQLNINKINKHKAVCSKHFVGGKGPTELFPDPIQADGSTIKPSRPKPKRRCESPTTETVTKRRKVLFEDKRREAIQESQALAADYIQLYVVGIGHFVDHNELHSLVQDPTYVFSTTDSELLTTILHTTAHADCTDCVQSTSTDILLLLDSRSREKIKHYIKSGIEMVRFLDIDSTDINMGIYTYSDSIEKKVPIEKHSENELLLSLPVITLSTSSDENLSRVVSHGKQELDVCGRADSKKLLILFSDGQFNDLIDMKNAVQNATDEETTVLIFGAGETVNHTAIRNVVTDSYYALLSASSNEYTPLQTVKSESWYTVCAEDIFQARV